MFKTSAFDG